MATLVLTAVGAVFGGPAALLATGVLGATGLLGGGRSRQGPRLNDLAVQSSAYGTPLPRLYGKMRSSGSVIWATDIKERSHKSGGGKGKPKTTTYSYSVSLAVALSARPVRSIGRIWADGKLIRSADGQWIVPATIRLYRGEGDETPDPLIVSAEGMGATPAYRGMAYVVFEDLDLSDFANHIPSLSFEVEADEGPITPATIIDDLCGPLRMSPAEIATPFAAMQGFGVATAGPVRSVLDTLSGFDRLLLRDDGIAAGLAIATMPEPVELDVAFAGAMPEEESGDRPARIRIERGAAGLNGSELSITYYDMSRDYQAGLQRAHFGTGGNVERIELPAALTPADAKALAERKMAKLAARRISGTIRLPYRAAAFRPGDILCNPQDGGLWQVREVSIERMTVELLVERVVQPPMRIPDADGGRPAVQNSQANGQTLLQVLDLPPLFDDLPTAPRLWLATAGEEQGWRRADIALSLDNGGSWQSIHTANGASVIGTAINVLGPSSSALWDDRHFLDVELAHDGMWLEGRTDAALLSGANLALLDNEIIQFGSVEALGDRRFRLRHMLRGRRGTEWAAAEHGAGGRFVMLDPALIAAFEPPASQLGAHLQFRATGPGQAPGEGTQFSLQLAGRALLPPAPVHLAAEKQPNGDIAIHWIRRSRQGWGWHDGVDAPLGEEREAYRLTLSFAGGGQKIIELDVPWFVYSATERIADSAVGAIEIEVSQLSALAGAGTCAALTFDLEA